MTDPIRITDLRDLAPNLHGLGSTVSERELLALLDIAEAANDAWDYLITRGDISNYDWPSDEPIGRRRDALTHIDFQDTQASHDF